ncbi:hypothetical protein K458DRAFT_384773 [Lentithecium fluviatile CBS 122367]|uniref:Uncharacterized protein n=1 Tax=Lentithecium fluviatile CBS 122367 TaxID=1168545 RepID=A0A6G1JEN0_9PLEO|nr:hypothetical protein K458DRAFT_384773 [Lentithecium fluviatile CBS 122367]
MLDIYSTPARPRLPIETHRLPMSPPHGLERKGDVSQSPDEKMIRKLDEVVHGIGSDLRYPRPHTNAKGNTDTEDTTNTLHYDGDSDSDGDSGSEDDIVPPYPPSIKEPNLSDLSLDDLIRLRRRFDLRLPPPTTTTTKRRS